MAFLTEKLFQNKIYQKLRKEKKERTNEETPVSNIDTDCRPFTTRLNFKITFENLISSRKVWPDDIRSFYSFALNWKENLFKIEN